MVDITEEADVVEAVGGGGCSILGCVRPHYARGWCSMHWKRWWTHGDPLTVQGEQEPAEMFWARIVKHSSGCWLWTGQRIPSGYGIWRKRVAHRAVYELLVGPVPDGMELDHLCHTATGCCGGWACPHRACVNPAHLEPVTHLVNVRRGMSPLTSGAHNRAKTHCPSGHPYDDANTRIKSSGGRECRTCRNERKREARAQGRMVKV